MKALVLAGGLGTRLRPLTDKTPKPLLPVQGRPLLQYHIEALKSAGVNNILINTHYLHEQIENFARTHNGVDTVYEPTLLGSAGTLVANRSYFENEEIFLVVYGDVLTDIDYQKLLEEHQSSGNVVTIACYEEEHPETKGVIVFGEDKRIIEFKEKPKTEEIKSRYANAGIYAVKSEIFSHLPRAVDGLYDFGHDVFPALLKKDVPMNVYLHSGLVLDIGSPESYSKANQIPL